MTSSNPHSAAGQAAGYYYQIERAVARLAEADKTAVVAIEKEDDVSVRMEDGRMILEQDKHTLGNRHPFTDGSKALWNTLDIWSAAIESDEIDPTMCSFYMVTNVAVVDGIVTQLSDATGKEAVEQALADLRSAATTAPKTSEAMARRVAARCDSILSSLIENIQCLDSTRASSGGDLRRRVASLLHLPEDLSEIDILNGLHGWVVAQIMNMWRDRRPAVISRVTFDRQLHRLISKFRTYKKFGMPAHLIPIVEGERDRHLGEQYVKQLRFVKVGPEEVIEAIDDYIRCSTERFRLETEGDLSVDDWEDFEGSLTRSWENIFRKEVRLGKGRPEEEVGYKILCDTRGVKASLGEVEAHQYLVCGTYHRFGNHPNKILGWHPRYRDLL